MIDRQLPELSVRRQCELLRVSRSGLYYEPEPTHPEQLALMRRLDELHLKSPFYGSRKLADALRSEGREVNRKRVQRLMRLMGLEAMAPKPRTSEPHPEHVVYPYPMAFSDGILLRVFFHGTRPDSALELIRRSLRDIPELASRPAMDK